MLSSSRTYGDGDDSFRVLYFAVVTLEKMENTESVVGRGRQWF